MTKGMTSPIFDERWLALLRERLAARLPGYLKSRRWFAGKSDEAQSVDVWEAIPLPLEGRAACLFFVRVNFASGKTQDYALPLMLSEPGASPMIPPEDAAHHSLLKVEGVSPPCVLWDAFESSAFAVYLLELIKQGGNLSGYTGKISGCPRPAWGELLRRGEGPTSPSLMRVEQSNTSVRYGDRFILKFFRRLEEGRNLDLEMVAFLTERAFFHNCPPILGAIELHRRGVPPVTLALLQVYVANQGDAWRYTLRELPRHLERIEERLPTILENTRFSGSTASWIDGRIPPPAQEIMVDYLDNIALLGQRTAALHRALASDLHDPDFKPEPFTPDFQRETSNSMIRLAEQAFGLLRERLDFLPPVVRRDAGNVLALEGLVLHRFRALRDRKIRALRARHHGDYHLGQVLYTGSDFVIIDFEGEPERPLAERRLKRSPLRDVAGMLRSFHYAARTAIAGVSSNSLEISAATKSGAQPWKDWVSTAFLKAYHDAVKGSPAFFQDNAEMIFLLDLYLLEKSVYELVYELNNRPGWAAIPLEGILSLVQSQVGNTKQCD